MNSAVNRPRTWLPPFAICVVVTTIVLIPLIATVLGGFKTNAELLTSPFGLPSSLYLDNFKRVLSTDPSVSLFWSELLNSLFSVLGTLAVLLVSASLAAFVLARVKFPGRELVFNLFLLGLLFPLTVAMLPLYITIRQLGLLGNLWGVILPQAAFALPTTILILRNFFRAIPSELEDAATIDGATLLGFFWRVLLPLSRPALAVVSMLAAVASWNNFLLPLLVLNDETQETLPLGMYHFQGQYATDWAAILAFVTVAMIPAIVIYLLAERQIVSGLTAGAIKG